MIVGVFDNERIQELAEDIDVIGLVTQGVAEHLTDAGELVLTREGEDHSEEAVELSPFHHLTKHENILGESLLVFEDGKIDVTTERAGVGNDEVILGLDGGEYPRTWPRIRVG